MSRRFTSAACLALAFASMPATAAEAAGAYPLASVLDAVRNACSDLSTRDAAVAKVAASGWTRAADPAATPVGALVAMGYEQGRKLFDKTGGHVDAGPLVFSRQVAGETLYLVLSSIVSGGTSVVGCRTYDVGETRRIDKAAASRWVGDAPDAAIERAELTKYTWNAGLQPEQDSFEIFYVPAGSPLIALVKVAGIAIKADQISDLPR